MGIELNSCCQRSLEVLEEECPWQSSMEVPTFTVADSVAGLEWLKCSSLLGSDNHF